MHPLYNHQQRTSSCRSCPLVMLHMRLPRHCPQHKVMKLQRRGSAQQVPQAAGPGAGWLLAADEARRGTHRAARRAHARSVLLRMCLCLHARGPAAAA